MGMRKYCREIARNRLKAMDVGNVNKKMAGKARLSHGKVRKMLKTKKDRKQLIAFRKAGVQLWRRVLWGDMANYGYMAQCHPEELKRKQRRGLFKRPIVKPSDIKGTIKARGERA